MNWQAADRANWQARPRGWESTAPFSLLSAGVTTSVWSLAEGRGCDEGVLASQTHGQGSASLHRASWGMFAWVAAEQGPRRDEEKAARPAEQGALGQQASLFPSGSSPSPNWGQGGIILIGQVGVCLPL